MLNPEYDPVMTNPNQMRDLCNSSDICSSTQFWEKKFAFDGLPAPISRNTVDDWLNEYFSAHNAKKWINDLHEGKLVYIKTAQDIAILYNDLDKVVSPSAREVFEYILAIKGNMDTCYEIKYRGGKFEIKVVGLNAIQSYVEVQETLTEEVSRNVAMPVVQQTITENTVAEGTYKQGSIVADENTIFEMLKNASYANAKVYISQHGDTSEEVIKPYVTQPLQVRRIRQPLQTVSAPIPVTTTVPAPLPVTTEYVTVQESRTPSRPTPKSLGSPQPRISTPVTTIQRTTVPVTTVPVTVQRTSLQRIPPR